MLLMWTRDWKILNFGYPVNVRGLLWHEGILDFGTDGFLTKFEKLLRIPFFSF